MARPVGTIAILLLTAAAVFCAGYFAETPGAPARPEISRGHGLSNGEQASLAAGDTVYGIEPGVAWTDREGVLRTSGWPACLPPGDVDAVRFIGARVSLGDAGQSQARARWVDCRGR